MTSTQPRSARAEATRARLIAAGETIFARDGLRTGQIRAIVQAAGQANDSAVHYHFGSRGGLALAIFAKHIEAMEPARRAWLEVHADPTVGELVGAIVGPLLERLAHPDGRAFLQIAAQVATEAGVGTGDPAPPLDQTAIGTQLDLLHGLLRGSLGKNVAALRISASIALLTATLAARARALDAGVRPRLSVTAFEAELVAMITALLNA